MKALSTLWVFYVEIKLKVSMHCEKCKIEVMKVVTELSGVDEIYVDLEKEILVVIGEVDPVSVAIRLRKKRRVAEILSVRKHKSKNKVLSYPRAYYNNSCQNGYKQDDAPREDVPGRFPSKAQFMEGMSTKKLSLKKRRKKGRKKRNMRRKKVKEEVRGEEEAKEEEMEEKKCDNCVLVASFLGKDEEDKGFFVNISYDKSGVHIRFVMYREMVTLELRILLVNRCYTLLEEAVGMLFLKRIRQPSSLILSGKKTTKGLSDLSMYARSTDRTLHPSPKAHSSSGSYLGTASLVPERHIDTKQVLG
ncbi:hypothetical protein OSB04_003262 [Centaurea solstitialis]|uniref:HMA domain-containing protein n=1 Tax=Centaurea solstitialis TaxID=347529 RepID=A0AA38U4Z2_9ASTR|nr:hypothetical protein OSB04_003262 [Centaurea solstitialis]